MSNKHRSLGEIRRSRLKALRRRRDHLAERVADYWDEGDPSHDKAELSALNWAIRIIEALPPELLTPEIK